MSFTHSQLQACYESNLAEAADLSGELRQVRALIAVKGSLNGLSGTATFATSVTMVHPTG